MSISDLCKKKRKTTYNQSRKYKISTQYQKDSLENMQYPTNFIRTSKYTLVNFIPLSLLMQFSRYANIYFLFIAIISSIPSISPLSPVTSILPLLFVLAVSMTREAYEDYQRHVNDNKLNSTECIRIEKNQEVKTTWKDLLVGDIIKVQNNQAFPADLLVLASEYENGNCYIETGALDGEKNMKPKQALKESQKLFKNGGNYEDLDINIQAESPNQDLYQFEGSIFIKGNNQEKSLLAGPKQLLLRGAFLRNTDYILGSVVYTGLDTKIMRNAEPGKLKQSDVEKKMNTYIIGILIFQICCSLTMAFLGQNWIDQNYDEHVYLQYDKDDTSGEFGVKNFFTYFILFNTMIPISLIVSLEIVKLCQSVFIVMDDEMYVREKNRRPNVFTSTLNEEVGQIEYVFSDKTGTLTCNVMEFKICLIGGKQYGSLNSSEEQQGTFESMTKLEKQKKKQEKEGEEEFSLTKYTFKDEDLENLLQIQLNNDQVNMKISSDDGQSSIQVNTQFDLAKEYFMLLSTSHECIVQKNKNQEITDISKISYGGPSPDEITLVDAAKHLGFTFLGSSSNSIMLNVLGEEIQVELLKLFEFDSDRKRMSVIVRDMNTKVIRMYTKGADSIIKARLSEHQPNMRFVDQKLHEFSILGLRTLLMTVKVISEQEYQEFDKKYSDLANVKNRDKLVKQLQSDIEQNLTLIGASAVEDKLQAKVPETIFDLIRANIKVWMLTGDKLETAENIGKSCKLVQDDMEKFYLTQTDVESLRTYIFGEAQQLFDRCLKHEQRKALLIQGETLALVLNNDDILKQFVNITQKCESVICCRVTPKQKALVVRVIKNSLKTITLAIGDGANDVNMIQEAHIGVGIYGNEGMRAVQASDFAFGEFQCLWRLILVHGRWSYIRNTEMILYFFYKNMLFTVPHFFYAFSNGFAGQIIFDDSYILLFNMVFTALPLVARAIFDQDVNYKVYVDKNKVQDASQSHRMVRKKEKYSKNKFPELYYIGQQQKLFSISIFLNWVIQGIAHSLFIYLITYYSLRNSISQEDGYDTDIWSFSLIMFTSVILVVSLRLAIYTKYWTIFNYIAFWATSIILYFLYFIITEYVSFTHVYRTPVQLLKSAHFYLIVFITTGAIFTFDMCIYCVERLIVDFGKSDILRAFMRQNNILKQKTEVVEQLPNIEMGDKFLKSFTSLMDVSDRNNINNNLNNINPLVINDRQNKNNINQQLDDQKPMIAKQNSKDEYYKQQTNSPIQNIDEKEAYDPVGLNKNNINNNHQTSAQTQAYNDSTQQNNRVQRGSNQLYEPEVITVQQNRSQQGPGEIIVEKGIQSASRNKLIDVQQDEQQNNTKNNSQVNTQQDLIRLESLEKLGNQ